jgi:dTMP kinase
VLIAIEGIDGAGKATAAKRLSLRLREAGRDVTDISFPRYPVEPYGPLLRDALRDSSGGAAGAHARALLFALDRYAATPSMLAATGTGDVVIDRWVWSNAAYLDAQLGAESAAWIVDLEINKLGLPVPDVTVLVAGAVDNARARVRRRASHSERIVDVLEEAVSVQEGAARAYEEFAADLGWTVLRNTGTVGEFNKAIDRVAATLLASV